MNKNQKDRLTAKYSIGVVSIVAMMIAVFLIGIAIYSLSTYNRSLEDRLDTLQSEIQDMSNGNTVAETTAFKESFEYEVDVLEEQFDRSMTNITIILSVFGLIVTITMIIMPIFTYAFLQKDQFDQLVFKTDDKIAKMSEEFAQLQAENQTIRQQMERTMQDTKDMLAPFQFSFDDIKIEPIHTQLISEEQVDSCYRKAYIYFALGKADASISLIEDILKIKPTDEKALVAKAQILHSQKNTGEAIRILTELIEMHPGCDEYRYYRGQLNFLSQSFESASYDFEFLCSKNPDNPDYMDKMAATLHKQRKTLDAIVYQTKAISLNPDNPQYYADRGIMYHALKQYPEALRDKQRAVELSNGNRLYYGICAATLYKMKRYDDAIADADRALSEMEQPPANMAFIFSFRGLAKACTGTYTKEDILDDLNYSVEIGSGNYRNYFRRAEYYIQIGEYALAKQDLKKAENGNPNDPEIAHVYSLMYKKLGNSVKQKEYEIHADDMGYISEPE